MPLTYKHITLYVYVVQSVTRFVFKNDIAIWLERASLGTKAI